MCTYDIDANDDECNEQIITNISICQYYENLC